MIIEIVLLNRRNCRINKMTVLQRPTKLKKCKSLCYCSLVSVYIGNKKTNTVFISIFDFQVTRKVKRAVSRIQITDSH